ncbi:hypothetical protein ACLBWT_07300 [Paenibacillus sp. D51F]
MPATKKEDIYFGLMMCLGMVVFMTFYNLYTHDLLGTMTWKEVLVQLLLVYVVASLLELFVVGPIAKKAAFSLPYDKSKKIFVILSLALCMVTGMVLCMSLYGLAMTCLTGGLAGESWLGSYFSLVGHNFIFALPLQLLVVGPLVRLLFAKFVQGNRRTELGG